MQEVGSPHQAGALGFQWLWGPRQYPWVLEWGSVQEGQSVLGAGKESPGEEVETVWKEQRKEWTGHFPWTSWWMTEEWPCGLGSVGG